MGFCGICGHSAEKGRKCLTCSTVLCYYHAYNSPVAPDEHGHRIEIRPSPNECFACVAPRLSKDVALASRRHWIDCSVDLRQPARWPANGWQEMADYLVHNYAPQDFEFELSPGATFMFRDFRRARVRGWMAGGLGRGARCFLRKADLMWGAADPNFDTRRSRWEDTFGPTATGPRLASIGGYDTYGDTPTFSITNQRLLR